MASAFGLSAEIERNLISQRTKAALTSKKAEGVKLGRPLDAKSRQLKLSKNIKRNQNLLDKGLSKAAISKIMGVGRQTFHRFIERMELNVSRATPIR